MSPLPFEVLTNGHCQGPKHLVVGDALLRRFNLEYDPDPLLEYISTNNEETIALKKVKRHRLGLEREFAELPLAALSWMARYIAMNACETRFASGNLEALLRFTSTFDVIHAPNIGTVFPVMTARSTDCLDKANAAIERIKQQATDADEEVAMIYAYLRESGTDAGLLADYERHHEKKIDLELFADIVDSRSFQMHLENLTVWNYRTDPANDLADGRPFSSQIVYSLGSGNVFGPKLSEWSYRHVDPPPPFDDSAGEVVMLAEDFLELRAGDVLPDLIVNNQAFTKFYVIVGEETVVSVEDEIDRANKQSVTLSLGQDVDYVGWSRQLIKADPDGSLLSVSACG